GETVASTLAGTGQIETVAAVVPGTSVKTHSAQGLGELRIFLAAIGTNHDNACRRLYLRDAIVAHGGRPVVSRANLVGAANRMQSTRPSFHAGLRRDQPSFCRLSGPERRGSM